MSKPKLVRITTVPISLNLLIRGQMKYMKEHGFEVYTASSDGPEIPELTEREGVPHKAFSLTRKITPVTDTGTLYAMTRWFRDLKPDIVHSHTPKAGLLAMMAARMAGVPHRLHTVAGMPLMESTGAKRKILERAEALTYACATRVYPNSNNLKAFIEDNFSVAADKIKVIGAGSSNGIDTAHFERTEIIENEAADVRRRYQIAKDDLVFGFVGRIVRDKGINELVQAFTGVLEKEPHAWLFLVGPFEDHLDPVSEETRERIRTNPRIVTTGFQKDIRPFLAACDVFVFPSYREGFPNVVLQAACMELPCIVSDINGCNEIITDGESGKIVPAKDSVALALAMEELAVNANLRCRLAGKAHSEVVRKYEQSVLWEKLRKEYLSLL